jgi:hypothetical protein
VLQLRGLADRRALRGEHVRHGLRRLRDRRGLRADGALPGEPLLPSEGRRAGSRQA